MTLVAYPARGSRALAPYEHLETMRTWMLRRGDQLHDGRWVTYHRRHPGRVELELDGGPRRSYTYDDPADVIRPRHAMPRGGVLRVPLELEAHTGTPGYLFAGLGLRVHFTDRTRRGEALRPLCQARHLRVNWQPSATRTINGEQADICVRCRQIDEETTHAPR